MAKNNIINKKKTWSFIADKINNSNRKLDYEEKKYGYQVFTVEGDTRYFINLYAPTSRKAIGADESNDNDYQDFVDNYKDVPDNIPPRLLSAVTLPEFIAKDADNKLAIHESSRPDIGGKAFATYWTGAGDNLDTGEIGGGDLLAILTEPSTVVNSIDVKFDPQYGDVYIHEGYAMWSGAGFGDCLSVEVIAPATQLQTSVNLDYEMDDHKVKYASGGPGAGTHGFAANPVLVPNRLGTGYWDYNGTLSYCAGQTGAYDIFDEEQITGRFINRVPVTGTNYSYTMLQSADSSLIPYPYFMRVTAFNYSATEWSIWMILTVYRERTI